MRVQNAETYHVVDQMPIEGWPVIGKALAGGYFAGTVHVGQQVFGIIVAPKAQGVIDSRWSKIHRLIEGAKSSVDGRQNTFDMLDGDCELALKVCNLTINGYSDWHIPSEQEMLACYRTFTQSPEQSENPLQANQNEAFDNHIWYWTSTQSADHSAKVVPFDSGQVRELYKSYVTHVRVVRWVDLSLLAHCTDWNMDV